MARSGGFGTSLNPFRTGSLGGFGQYDIGKTAADLADLERYRAEVAWGNGQISPDAYLAALRKALSAITDQNTTEYLSLQNKIDDAVYSIGRSQAQTGGLDALIAFDQASLSGLDPSSTRYQNIADTLKSELSQRTSREYGKVVRAYNDGKLSTDALIGWVKNALNGMSDPDERDQWMGTLSELRQRRQTEKDSAAYQDWQQDRLSDDAYLGYITARRDQYSSASPDWADWNRRLEDTAKTVKAQNLAAADSKFFNLYNEGKKTDAQALAYSRQRLEATDKNDPSYEEWRHRIVTLSYSTAQDQLIFDVNNKKRPVSALIAFYEKHLATITPGSPEYRSTFEQLQAARKAGKAGGGGGGGGGGGSSSGGTKIISGAIGSGKVGALKYSLASILPAIQLGYGDKTNKTKYETFFADYDALDNAWRRGDRYWAYIDPSKPGAVMQARDADGNKLVDKNGKPVMTLGSAWLPVSDEAMFAMMDSKASFHEANALAYFANGKTGKGIDEWRQSMNLRDTLRGASNKVASRSAMKALDAIGQGVDAAMRSGDFVTALNLIAAAQQTVDRVANDPDMDANSVAKITGWQSRLESEPLLTLLNDAASTTDDNGRYTSVVFMPGVHAVFAKDAANRPTVKIVTEGMQTSEEWNAKHVTITTEMGDRSVTAEAAVTDGQSKKFTLYYLDATGATKSTVASLPVREVNWYDGSGTVHTSYSTDGVTWVTPNNGVLPAMQVQMAQDPATGDITYADAQGRRIGTQGATAKTIQASYDPANPPSAWYGQATVEAAFQKVRNPFSPTWGLDPLFGRIGESDQEVYNSLDQSDVGGPGQSMSMSVLGADGLNMLSDTFRTITKAYAAAATTGPRLTFGPAVDAAASQARTQSAVDSVYQVLTSVPKAIGQLFAGSGAFPAVARQPAIPLKYQATPALKPVTKLVAAPNVPITGMIPQLVTPTKPTLKTATKVAPKPKATPKPKPALVSAPNVPITGLVPAALGNAVSPSSGAPTTRIGEH